MPVSLKVLTLNCWGIAWPISSPDRKKRIAAIADKLSDSHYDIVSLQEIWSEDDFEFIRKRVRPVLPHSFYFHSGFTGSGVCIFSKGDIVDTLMFRYSLNGYAHHIHRGDWFGGKVVGLTHIFHHGLHIFVYATHIHAEYDKKNDLYLPHRLVQAYELSQFVKTTSRGADVTIALGDMNLEPDQLGHKLILANAHLLDSWAERKETDIPDDSDTHGNTCDIPANKYVTQSSLDEAPLGKRIDYILYNSRHDINIFTKRCFTQMGRVPEANLSYSDHEGLFSEFEVEVGSDAVQHRHLHREQSLELRPLILESMGIITRAVSRISYDRKFMVGALAIFFVIFLYTIDLELSYPSFAKFVIIARFVLTLGIGYVVWNGLVMMRMEQKGLMAAREGMNVLLRRSHEPRDESPDRSGTIDT